MKQIIQDLKTGKTILEVVPAPLVKPGSILIKTSCSLVSLGTERMLVDFGKSNLIDKARRQPDKVKQVIDKIKSDGLISTVEAVLNKLGQPVALGYCNVGRVVAVGTGVTEFMVGDRVASNGPHAEYVSIPKNLAVKIPDNVTDNEAAFTVIGSIALQGIRLLKPQIGETVVVIGLGLIGLIAIQILKANGCNVIGIDNDDVKISIAHSFGITAIKSGNMSDVVKLVNDQTSQIGADAVLITASTKSHEVIHQAAQMSRKRGRIVLIGVIGLNIQRDDFYKKELSFKVSCSYGPGRYDDNYEQKGIDYPLPFVRWTEKRNFQTVLQLISSGQIDVAPLITEKVTLDDYKEVYDNMHKHGSIASIIEYLDSDETPKSVVNLFSSFFSQSEGGIGIIGAGNFISSTMLPILIRNRAPINYIASANGLSAEILARKAKVLKATSDYHDILKDKNVDTVIIATRHNLHSKMIVEALNANKNVFVEKPLCLNEDELKEIITAYEKNNLSLTVGFNRRFSPFALKLKELAGNGCKNIVATMNAGFIPGDSWVHDLSVGGGRIIGEACHFIDLCSYITDSRVVAVCMNAMGKVPQADSDNVSILLKYEDGSNAVINYFSNGSKSYSKERVEVYSHEKTLILDNWRTLKAYGVKGFSVLKGKMDKGHNDEIKALLQRINSGGSTLIPFDSIINTTKASFACIKSLLQNKWIIVDE